MNAIVREPEAFASLGNFLSAVIAAGGQGGGVDRDEIDRRLRFASAALGQNAGVGEAGGYAIADDFAVELWERALQFGRILALCDRQPMPRSGRLKMPAIGGTDNAEGSRFGGVKMVWNAEGEQVDGSQPKIEVISLELKKLIGLIYGTEELFEDGAVLAAAVRRIFGMEAAFKIEDAIINGNGTTEPLGVLNSPCCLTIAKEAAQVADSIDPLNLVNMAQALWGPSHANAMWLMSNDVWRSIVNSDDIDFEGFVIDEGPNRRYLLQMPVELGEYTAPLGDRGDIILGDFTQYLLAEKEPNVLSSIHARFVYDEMALKFRYRVDGAPGWAKPIKPKNSANLQAPFVTLAERA